eukprot:TRINITY_DN5320_c0_g2_i1.p1 TRINITY_DN5320_c0_g2~~TRINITY_DN5320_c0_g2_i1.p1  ORF type:complete len:470 (-),score=67.87 TRINITY_DN5320_c0_g2_i1:34-1254(-)
MAWKDIFRRNCMFVDQQLLKHLYAPTFSPLLTPCLRITLIGESNVGKTALIERFVENKFIERDACRMDWATASISRNKGIYMNGRRLDLTILKDTSAFEVEHCSFVGTQIILICFDLSSSVSFKRLQRWFDRVQAQLFEQASVFIIIGCKSDLKRAVPYDEANLLATNKRCIYFETSARKGSVDVPFHVGIQTALRVSQLAAKLRGGSVGGSHSISTDGTSAFVSAAAVQATAISAKGSVDDGIITFGKGGGALGRRAHEHGAQTSIDDSDSSLDERRLQSMPSREVELCAEDKIDAKLLKEQEDVLWKEFVDKIKKQGKPQIMTSAGAGTKTPTTIIDIFNPQGDVLFSSSYVARVNLLVKERESMWAEVEERRRVYRMKTYGGFRKRGGKTSLAGTAGQICTIS